MSFDITRRFRLLERKIKRELAGLSTSDTTQDAAIDAVEADVANLAPLGPAGIDPDLRFNDYLFTGVIMLMETADLASLPEGWFAADGTNGTLDMTLAERHPDTTFVQQVGPYPS